MSPKTYATASPDSNFSLGEEFYAFGYPPSVFGPSASEPTARLFTGNFQRFIDHQSHLGYRYIAGEMSIACPQGLSGAPVFRPGAPVMLLGLVTENLQTYTALESVEEVIERGEVRRTEVRNVINYGVTLMLHELQPWLDSSSQGAGGPG